MRQVAKWLMAVFLASGSELAIAADTAPNTTYRLSDLAWLAGVWRAQNGADQVEELYLPIRNGEILGTFTASVDGKVTRYELRSIREEAGKIIFQELAYKSGLQADLPVPTRVVVSSDATHINFDGLTIVRTGENTMTVTVQLVQPTARTVQVQYSRVLKLSSP